MHDLLILGSLLLAGVTATKLAFRMGVPALVLFIAVGMGLGSYVYFDDAFIAQFVGTTALVVILFEGGLQTSWKQMRRVAIPAASLATLGVIVTAVLTGFLSWLLLGVDLPVAMLIGAIVGSTDAAAVFSVIGEQNIRTRLKYTLESESALNDPMAVLLTLLVLSWIQAGPPNLWQAIGFLFWQLAVGLVMGLVLGKIATWGLSRARFESSGLYPIFLFAIAITTFAVTSWINASGFIAVYVLGIFIGNMELPYRQSIFRFHEGMAWLAQMIMFMILGLLVFPNELGPVIGPGFLVAGGLLLVARPIAVWLTTLGMGFSTKELLLISWAGLRGSVPIVLATFPLQAGVPQSGLIFNIVFFVVVTSCLIQGSTIAKVAQWLGLTEGTTSTPPMTLELVAMEKLDVDLVELILPKGSPAEGKRLADLALPEQVTVSALIRSNRVVTPRGFTRLEAGDILFLLTHKNQSHVVRPIFEGADDAFASSTS